MNNLGERKVAGNFDLGKFLVFNYIQRNLLKTTFLEFLQNFSKSKYSQKYSKTSRPSIFPWDFPLRLVRVWRRKRLYLCIWNKMSVFLGNILILYFTSYVFNSLRIVLQKRQVTFLSCFWRHFQGGGSRVLIVGVPATCREKKGEGEKENGKDMVIEVETLVFMWNLHRRQTLRFIWAGIADCKVVLRVAGVRLFGERSLLMMKMKSSGVGFWLVHSVSLGSNLSSPTKP